MKRPFLLLPITLVILISGCTLPGDGSPVYGPGVKGKGIVIEYFEPDFKEVSSGQPVQFEYKIKNTGSQTAIGCYDRILDLDETEWGDTDKKTCTGYTEELQPPSPTYGTGGGSYTCTVEDLTAPDLPAGVSYTYHPLLRVMCTYDSITKKTVTLLPLDDARRLQQQGRTFSASTSSKTESPIDISITVKEPIKVFAEKTEFPIEIKVTNAGGGQPCVRSCEDKSNWNRVAVSLDTTGPIELGECPEERTLTLYQDSAAFTCTAYAQNSDITTPTSATITAGCTRDENTVYEYITDKSTSITVTGV